MLPDDCLLCSPGPQGAVNITIRGRNDSPDFWIPCCVGTKTRLGVCTGPSNISGTPFPSVAMCVYNLVSSAGLLETEGSHA